jgi:hypothetical protein
MDHSTSEFTRSQLRAVIGSVFSIALFQKAADRVPNTRKRVFETWMVLWAVVAWGIHPKLSLSSLLRTLFFWPKLRGLTESAFYQARKRLGWRPLAYLRRRIRFLANPKEDPTAFYHGWRLLAIDGWTNTVADTPENERVFGRSSNQHKRSGFPLVRVVGLCELGTHAMIRWIARPYRMAEKKMAARLIHHVPKDALLLGDRNFHSHEFWCRVDKQECKMLLRVSKTPKFPVLETYSDGSYLSHVCSGRKNDKKIKVRVISYQTTDKDGKKIEVRIVTNLLDPKTEPASELARLYAERWQEETTIKEFKGLWSERTTTQLRAVHPLTVMQELDGLLIGHYVVRHLMLEAARKAEVPVVQISFEGTIQLIRPRLNRLPKSSRGRKKWRTSLIDEINALPKVRKRRRSCPRVRKVVRCKWPVKTKKDREVRPPPIEQRLEIATPNPTLT